MATMLHRLLLSRRLPLSAARRGIAHPKQASTTSAQRLFLSTRPNPIISPASSSHEFVISPPSSTLASSSLEPAATTKPRGLTIGILSETYDDWERRTPLCPAHVQQLLDNNNNSNSTVSRVLVQSSSQRCFSNADYERAGAVVSNDLSQADIILGVKRPADPSTLLNDKTYVFFSHVIKGQESNMNLLQTVLDKKVQLMDYECIVDDNNNAQRAQRLVAFGKFAGLAGMIDSFYPLGRRLVTDYGIHTPFLQCPLASMQRDLAHAKDTIREVGGQIANDGLSRDLKDPLVFCLTGQGGRVFGGAMEIMELLPQECIQVQDLPELYSQSNRDPYRVYTVTPSPEDMYQRSSDGSFQVDDWRNHPSEYESKFATDIAPFIHCLVNCIYWDPRYARLLTKDETQLLHENGQNRLKVVSDISCDINGSIEFLDRTCTIAKPFFQYNPLTREEVCADIGDKGITVMGTDILPAELPKESSDHFGGAVVKLLEELANNKAAINDASPNNKMDLQHGPPILSNSCITTPQGVLAPRFRYLDSFLQMAPSTVVESNQSMDVLLNGHLFDSGLINTILDTAEHLECGFQIVNCRVNRGGHAKDVVPTEKSTALVQFVSENQANLDKLEAKIQTLIDVMDKAEASMKVVDRSTPKEMPSSGGSSRQFGSGTAVVESQEEQKVLVLGAGRVSMSLVDLLGRTSQKHIKVASDSEDEARDVAKLAARGTHVGLDLKNAGALASLVKEHDVVISLLPAPLHASVAEECIQQKTNLVTASYESPEMREMNERAKAAGIIIMNEVGLDPGLDHMSAMKIIDDINSRGGTVRSFKSVCGGLPAPEAANNPLKYKFSWSPKGVISASQNAARYRWEDEIVDIAGPDLMTSVMSFDDAWPEMGLECLPNRDSLKYESIYGIDQAQTLFRGTLRFQGFCSLMSIFQKIGLFETSSTGGPSWGEALTALRQQRGSSEDMDDFLLECSGGDQDKAQKAKTALHWLEMEGATIVSNTDSVVDSFCAVLEKQLQFGDDERDMVAMHTHIVASFEDGTVERHQSSMLAFGDDSMSAMCRTVGFPAAAAADLVLSGNLSKSNYTGLVLPIDKEIYLPILAAVEKEGIAFKETVVIDS